MDYLKFAEDNKISSELAKKIIDALVKRNLEPTNMNFVIFQLEKMIKNEAIKAKLNKSTGKQINQIVEDIVIDRQEFLSEIILSEGNEVVTNKAFELLTTAKQTNPRYGDFQFSKKDLEEMATNFNEDVVGTEIPVDLNHDPEHLAYAWIKPGSMIVRESDKLKGQFSLFGELHRYTPEGEDMIKTGKIRYFSLQIQPKLEKFVDKSKKIYKNVIRALAFTNMPVIKDMSPTFSESGVTLFNNPKEIMEKQELELKLSEASTKLTETQTANTLALAEKDKENKELSGKLELAESEKLEKFLSEEVEGLCLSEDNKVGFKGGEKENVLAFVKTLSEDQAKAYFTLHKNIITGVDLSEHGRAGDEGDKDVKYTEENAETIANERAMKLSKEKDMSFSEAFDSVLEDDKDLAKHF